MNDKRDLAKVRTEFAEERTLLANQRTFSAWIRTGLSSVLAGLAIARFVGSKDIFEEYVIFIGIFLS